MAGMALANTLPGMVGTGASYYVGGTPAIVGNLFGSQIMGMLGGITGGLGGGSIGDGQGLL